MSFSRKSFGRTAYSKGVAASGGGGPVNYTATPTGIAASVALGSPTNNQMIGLTGITGSSPSPNYGTLDLITLPTASVATCALGTSLLVISLTSTAITAVANCGNPIPGGAIASGSVAASGVVGVPIQSDAESFSQKAVGVVGIPILSGAVFSGSVVANGFCNIAIPSLSLLVNGLAAVGVLGAGTVSTTNLANTNSASGTIGNNGLVIATTLVGDLGVAIIGIAVALPVNPGNASLLPLTCNGVAGTLSPLISISNIGVVSGAISNIAVPSIIQTTTDIPSTVDLGICGSDLISLIASDTFASGAIGGVLISIMIAPVDLSTIGAIDMITVSIGGTVSVVIADIACNGIIEIPISMNAQSVAVFAATVVISPLSSETAPSVSSVVAQVALSNLVVSQSITVMPLAVAASGVIGQVVDEVADPPTSSITQDSFEAFSSVLTLNKDGYYIIESNHVTSFLLVVEHGMTYDLNLIHAGRNNQDHTLRAWISDEPNGMNLGIASKEWHPTRLPTYHVLVYDNAYAQPQAMPIFFFGLPVGPYYLNVQNLENRVNAFYIFVTPLSLIVSPTYLLRVTGGGVASGNLGVLIA